MVLRLSGKTSGPAQLSAEGDVVDGIEPVLQAAEPIVRS